MSLVLLALLAACSGGGAQSITTTTGSDVTTPSTATGPPVTAGSSGTPVEGSGDNPISVFSPPDAGPYPVIVTVHGGGWVGGDPEDMAALAERLGEDAVVFNVTYRTLSRGGRFPEIVEDIACDVVSAHLQAAAYTTTPDDLYLVGHSAGAHLAALVAFAPQTFTCDGEVPDIDGFVGLAGPYDVARLPILNTMFGATIDDDPAVWALGNPRSHVETARALPILLVHGSDDQVVPISFSTDLLDDLEAAGADVELIELPGVDHAGVKDPSNVATLIETFVGSHRPDPPG